MNAIQSLRDAYHAAFNAYFVEAEKTLKLTKDVLAGQYDRQAVEAQYARELAAFDLYQQARRAYTQALAAENSDPFGA